MTKDEFKKKLEDADGWWIYMAQNHYQIGACTFHRMNGIKITSSDIPIILKRAENYCIFETNKNENETRLD